MVTFFKPSSPRDHWKAVTRAQDRLTRAHTGRVRTTLTRAMNKAARDIARGLPGDSTLDLRGLEKDYERMYMDAAVRFARATYEDIEKGTKRSITELLFDWEEEVRNLLKTVAGSRITAITSSLRSEVIRPVLAMAQQEGWGMAKAAQELRAKWADVKGYRATRIVRTEIISASNAGSMMGARAIEDDLGIPLKKNWLATMDGRVRPDHAAANGQQRAMNEPFSVGGASLMQPGDPSGPPGEVINCRCTVTYEVDE